MSDIDQEERLDYLVEAFKRDSDDYKDLETPKDRYGKQALLRGLMNIRPPRRIGEDVLRVQDEYLSLRNKEKGIVTPDEIPVIRSGMSIWQGDITRLACDAIVNAANSQMIGCFIPGHNCIDNCIHTFAGIELRAECAEKMDALRRDHGQGYEQPTAVPMLTEAYNLPAKKVIHIVGPIVSDSLTTELERDLADCYEKTLDMCRENGLRSIAFCCISTGIFRFPKDRAAEIAVETVEGWLASHEGAMDRVIFNVFGEEDREIYERILA